MSAQSFPRVPDYAWAWLQRSRPLVGELAHRLTGAAPSGDFLQGLRARLDSDPFTARIVADTVAEVAFAGRVPARRPPGAAWDRGLTWWAAALAGVPLREYDVDDAAKAPAQRMLFELGPQAGAAEPGRDAADASGPAEETRVRRPRGGAAQRERRALALALRQLLEAGDGEQVPASAIRQLLSQLEAS